MSTKPRNTLTGTGRNHTAGLPITKVGTTSWGDAERAESTAEISADIESALDQRRKGAVDPPVGNRELLAAAQKRLAELMANPHQ